MHVVIEDHSLMHVILNVFKIFYQNVDFTTLFNNKSLENLTYVYIMVKFAIYLTMTCKNAKMFFNKKC